PLEGTGRYVLPVEFIDSRHVYNQFVIRSDRRDALMAFLKKRNIGTEIYYPVPMHVQECFTSLGYRVGDFPASERAAAESLALPIYPELSDEMIGEVIRGLAWFLSVERIEHT